jgi:hypothetical protein
MIQNVPSSLFLFDVDILFTRFHSQFLLFLQRKVEEERYIKSKEHEDYLKRKAAAAAAAPELSAEELAAKRAHDAAVDEAFEILSRTGCKVKDETVEALAAWKLGGK